jgi:hypothetical protein
MFNDNFSTMHLGSKEKVLLIAYDKSHLRPRAKTYSYCIGVLNNVYSISVSKSLMLHLRGYEQQKKILFHLKEHEKISRLAV